MIEKVIRNKKYEPDDDTDWSLSSISIDEAENGVVISCSYTLKPEVRDKMRKQDNYCSDYCPPEKHVFEDKAAAKKFIMSELNAMWADNEE